MTNQKNTTKLLCYIDLLRNSIDLLRKLHLLLVTFCNLILRLSAVWPNLLFSPHFSLLPWLAYSPAILTYCQEPKHAQCFFPSINLFLHDWYLQLRHFFISKLMQRMIILQIPMLLGLLLLHGL